MTTRAVPFHCPYCADEDLRPHGDTHGEWECRSCLRAFRLGFIGQLAPSTLTTHPAPTHDTAAPTGRRTAS
jgi:ribosomal protein L37AE/L43A